ncbi:YkvI family membrane protein [Caldalkalibacillus mannanilyticus]|uniref:YkvI family membrane protein n=1 Tax=Caldalkalibacillus mannanilyticus TaxID=1418 RepID=UPI0004688FEE|nr:hypothetical protein [Caldalkalibacillus mannanilyticus]
MKKRGMMVAQVAATYIGTVVGAGFATGQEIVRFFTVYHVWGLLGILLSTFLFIWLGTKMMVLSHRIKAYSYQELNVFLFGRTVGTVVNLFVLVILFGVTSVMLSGTGSIFQEQLGLSYQLGIILTILLCYMVMLKGLKGIFMVNSLVVPLMLLFSLVVLVSFGWLGIQQSVGGGFQLFQEGELLGQGKWLASALTYVAFNLAMAQAVLVPLGKEIEDESILKWGGIWGGIGLGFMLLASHFALLSFMPEALQLDIPMALVIKDIGWFLLFLFLLVVYGEVFTTLIGNVFGIARQIHQVVLLPEKWTFIMILLSSFVISQVGFSALVSYLYPFFGYMGLFLLLFLIVKKQPQ